MRNLPPLLLFCSFAAAQPLPFEPVGPLAPVAAEHRLHRGQHVVDLFTAEGRRHTVPARRLLDGRMLNPLFWCSDCEPDAWVDDSQGFTDVTLTIEDSGSIPGICEWLEGNVTECVPLEQCETHFKLRMVSTVVGNWPVRVYWQTLTGSEQIADLTQNPTALVDMPVLYGCGAWGQRVVTVVIDDENLGTLSRPYTVYWGCSACSEWK